MIPVERVPKALVRARCHKDEGLSNEDIVLEFGDYAILIDDPEMPEEIHAAHFVDRIVDSYNVCAPYINPAGLTTIMERLTILHQLYDTKTDPVTIEWQQRWDEAMRLLSWAFVNLKTHKETPENKAH